MKNNNLVFIITSAIHLSNKPLSYTSIRSVFTPEERLKQTYRTIRSVKTRYKNAYIILLEHGKEKPMLSAPIKKMVDQYIYLGDNLISRLTTDSPWKNSGEAVALILANKYLANKGNFYIKLSGRYYLNKNINLNTWDLQKFNFLEKDHVYSTRLYGFPKELFSEWHHTLIKSIPFLLANNSIESVLTKLINRNKINFLHTLGVSGFASCTGGLIEE